MNVHNIQNASRKIPGKRCSNSPVVGLALAESQNWWRFYFLPKNIALHDKYYK